MPKKQNPELDLLTSNTDLTVLPREVIEGLRNQAKINNGESPAACAVPAPRTAQDIYQMLLGEEVNRQN